MKRDRLQVIKDILKVVQEKSGKIRPTHIMYKANLSHQMLEEYLKELMDKGFIKEEKQKKGKTYSITDKGHNYLQQYKLIINFTDSFGLN